MEPMTPNTAAFLTMLSSIQSQPNHKPADNPTSLPPSAFWPMPVPGRDTPENSPESSVDASVEKDGGNGNGNGNGRGYSVSDDSDAQEKEAGNHKRKAGRGSGAHAHPPTVTQSREEEEDDEDDSEGDSPSGHEGKRQHQSAKNIRGGRRKSGAADDTGKPGKDGNKAAKRKEQNRAAQKAFRERREARVKDLETKVAELEAKSFGATVENENLRGILKRLQEENVALKQSAFTFSVPLSGSGNPSPNTSAPKYINQPNAQAPKPPTPPHTVSNDSLRSIDDIPSLNHRQSTSSGNGAADSPDSLNSIGSSSSDQMYGKDRFNNTALSGLSGISGAGNFNPSTFNNDNINIGFGNGISNGSGSETFSPSSLSSTNKSELDALWASFYPNGFPGISPSPQNQAHTPSKATSPQQNQNQNQVQNQNQNSNANQFLPQPAPFASPLSFLNSQTDYMSFGDTGLYGNGISNSNSTTAPFNGNDRMAFRDPNPQSYRDQTNGSYTNLPTLNQPLQTAPGSGDNWADLTDNSVSDFLASLTGGNTDQINDLGGFENDDLFNQQIQQMLAATATAPGLGVDDGKNSVFSPTNYLNMSPSPLNSNNSNTNSISNSQSPSSVNNYVPSNSASPNSSTSEPSSHASGSAFGHGNGQGYGQSGKAVSPPGLSTFGPAKLPSEMVHIVGLDGKIVKPSELWEAFNSRQEDVADALLIDDLCDQMKAKATCKDGMHTITVEDAKMMMLNRPDYSPFNRDPADRARLRVVEPEKCQHVANEAFMAIHGIKP